MTMVLESEHDTTACVERLIAAAIAQDQWAGEAAGELAKCPPDAIPQRYRVHVRAIAGLWKRGEPHNLAEVYAEADRLGVAFDGLASELAALDAPALASCQPKRDAGAIREAFARVRTIEKLQLAARLCKDAPLNEVRATLDGLGVLDDLPDGEPGQLFADLTDWRGLAALEIPWTFAEAIPRGQASIIGGRGGCGKSTLARGLALSVLTGRTIIPGFEPVASGPVIVLSGEDSAPIWLRSVLRYAELHAIPGDEMDAAMARLHLRSGHARPFIAKNMAGEYATTPYYEEIRRAAVRIKPRLVIVDTLRQHAGLDAEASPGAGGMFVQTMGELAAEVGAAVVVCAHTTKQSAHEGASIAEHVRGSSALTDEARSCWVLTFADGMAKLTATKQNYAPVAKTPILLAFDGAALVDASVTVDAAALFEAVAAWIAQTPVSRYAVSRRQGPGALMLREIRAQIEGVAPADIVAALDAGVESGVFCVAEMKRKNGAIIEVVRVAE